MHPLRARCTAVAIAAGACALGGEPARALPLISELYYDAVGSDDGQSFVELYGATGAALDGLVLEVVNGSNGSVVTSLPLVGFFPADGLFVVADTDSEGFSAVAGADQLANFDIQNGPDSLLLRSETRVLDALGFGDFGSGDVFAGEGSPAPDVPAGWSLARRFADLDTDDNAADFVGLEIPTPGMAPLVGVPEPGAAGLWALGLSLLALRLGLPRARSSAR